MTKELDKIVYDTILMPAVKAMKKKAARLKAAFMPDDYKPDPKWWVLPLRRP